nr:MAG: hypothetical protein 2 [Leviviridae sp.]UJQ85218.1 MAG: hypothetical protein 2 [Leviviridae sp.]
MFADPTVITINAVAKNLIRINQDGYASEYLLRETTGEYRLRIRNSSYADKARGGKKVDRHNVELVHTVYPVAPAVFPTIRKDYHVFEMDVGDDSAIMAKTVAALSAFVTEANATKMLNFES